MIEKYAFITNENYELHVQSIWPNAITVGENYRMIQFSENEEAGLISMAESLGFTCKNISAEYMIDEMESVNNGPFKCSHADASIVVTHFNPPEDE
jgi:hypothetical protein